MLKLTKLNKKDYELHKAFIRSVDREFQLEKNKEGYHRTALGQATRAFNYAKKYESKLDVDLEGLTRIVIRSKNTDIICRYMLEIPRINLSRLAYTLTTIDGDWRPILKIREKFPSLYSGPLDKRISYLKDMEIIQQVLQ